MDTTVQSVSSLELIIHVIAKLRIMRKGLRIKKVTINSAGTVTAIDTTGSNVKLTRSQRNIFTTYKRGGYIDRIAKEFNLANIDPDFEVIGPTGEVVFRLNET